MSGFDEDQPRGHPSTPGAFSAKARSDPED